MARDVSPVVLSPEALVGMMRLAESDFLATPAGGKVTRDSDMDVQPVDDVTTHVVLDRYSETFEDDVRDWCNEHARAIEYGASIHVRQLSGERSTMAVAQADDKFKRDLSLIDGAGPKGTDSLDMTFGI